MRHTQKETGHANTERISDGGVDRGGRGRRRGQVPADLAVADETPRADGTIPQPVVQRLLEMGKWLKVNGEVVYGVALAWPGRQLTVKPLGTDAALLKGGIASVRLLGHTGKLKWTRTQSALAIDLPDKKPCQYAFVFKITSGAAR